MHNEFTAIIEQDGEWLIAYWPEIPGAIDLLLKDRRNDALRAVPKDATREKEREENHDKIAGESI